MDLRILVVEDEDEDFISLESILRAMPADDKKDWMINQIIISHASNAADALDMILDASQSEQPFDVIVLDLGLPPDATSTDPEDAHVDHGFHVLDIARRMRAGRQIVIYTQFAEDPHILRALRLGATDFVAKPRALGNDDKGLQRRFVTCWQRVLEHASASLLEERIKHLVPYAEAGLAQRYTACFSSFLQQVAQTAEEVQHYATERFGLDPDKDSQDYLIRCLTEQNNDLQVVKENWTNLNADLLNGNAEKLNRVSLRTLLDSFQSKWSPCLLVKNYDYENAVNDTGAGVLTFHQDVGVIVQEIIAGTLSLLPDYGKKHTLKVSAEMNNGQVAIVFSDDVANDNGITTDDAEVINQGLILGPHHGPKRFGRAWGLSVVQHLALRGGGRLIVQPQPTGSTITYFAPLQLNNN